MRFFATAIALAAGATAQFFDGYETVKSGLQPVQLRLSYSGPTAMLVSWNTFDTLENPSVRYGLSADHLDKVASSNVSYTYPTTLTYFHHVNLTDLRPDTTYYYLPSNDNVTTPYSFTTSRLAGDMTEYTVAVIVDMGTFGPLGLSDNSSGTPLMPGEQTTIHAISQQLDDFDFIVQPGDMGYADAWLKEEIAGYLPNTTIAGGVEVYEHINNAFYDELVPITSYKAYMVSPGNHESNCDNGGTTNKKTGVAYTESICPVGQTNFTGYRNRFRMPSGPSGGLESFWYSYDHGMTHFVSIDTETDLGHGLLGPDEGSPEESGPFGLLNQQIDWLQKDLASVDRSVTPWVVVLGHRPFYVSTSDVCANCSAAFEPLFHEYGVDLYFCGHSHVYERNVPIYNNVSDPNGLNNPRDTWYIVNGAAGHYDGLDTLDDPLQFYSAYAQDTQYSWSKLIFHNCTHLTQQALYSANNSVYDEATLFKNRTCGGNQTHALKYPHTVTYSHSATATPVKPSGYSKKLEW